MPTEPSPPSFRPASAGSWYFVDSQSTSNKARIYEHVSRLFRSAHAKTIERSSCDGGDLCGEHWEAAGFHGETDVNLPVVPKIIMRQGPSFLERDPTCLPT